MGIGVSVVLLALGAILYWAVTADLAGVSLDLVGVILMVAGGVGLLWAVFVPSGWTWRRHHGT